MSNPRGKRRAEDESLPGEAAGGTDRPSAGNTPPPALSEWLRLMLGEIEQKSAEADAATEEQRRREQADPTDRGQER